jgi:hypothetical protein
MEEVLTKNADLDKSFRVEAPPPKIAVRQVDAVRRPPEDLRAKRDYFMRRCTDELRGRYCGRHWVTIYSRSRYSPKSRCINRGAATTKWIENITSL